MTDKKEGFLTKIYGEERLSQEKHDELLFARIFAAIRTSRDSWSNNQLCFDEAVRVFKSIKEFVHHQNDDLYGC